MTTAQIEGLTAAALGAAGSIILFFSSYAVEPLEGSPFGGPVLDAANARTRKRNAYRLLWQRIGLALILVSFVVQGLSALGS